MCAISLHIRERLLSLKHVLFSVNGNSSSLAKGFAHGPLSLYPWQIELDFLIPADRHLAVFTSLAYKDDITFDQ